MLRARKAAIAAATAATIGALGLATPSSAAPAPAGASASGPSLLGEVMSSSDSLFEAAADGNSPLDSTPEAPGTPAPVAGYSCQDVPGAVDPLDLIDLTTDRPKTPPPGVAGQWAYKVCGSDGLVSRAVAGGDNATQIKAFCKANVGCSLITVWKANDPTQSVAIPHDDCDGFFCIFDIPPHARANPSDGRAIVNMPIWFYDENPNYVTGMVIPAPTYGAAAIAILIDTWWTATDRGEICDSAGHFPDGVDRGRITPAQAMQPNDCSATYTRAGRITGTLHRTWLVLLFVEFPPYVIPIPVPNLTSNVNMNVREVQAVN